MCSWEHSALALDGKCDKSLLGSWEGHFIYEQQGHGINFDDILINKEYSLVMHAELQKARYACTLCIPESSLCMLISAQTKPQS